MNSVTDNTNIANAQENSWYAIIDPDTRAVSYLMEFWGTVSAAVPHVAISRANYQRIGDLIRDGRSVVIAEDGSITDHETPKTLDGQQTALAKLTTQKKALGVYFQPAGASAPVLFASDDTAYANTLQEAQTAALGAWTDGTQWTLADGSNVPMTAADVTALFKKMAAYRAACQNRAAALGEALKTDLNTDLAAGWPDNHQEGA